MAKRGYRTEYNKEIRRGVFYCDKVPLGIIDTRPHGIKVFLPRPSMAELGMRQVQHTNGRELLELIKKEHQMVAERRLKAVRV